MRRKLKEKRLALGITQEEISNKVGFVRAHYSRIEAGLADPLLKVYFKLKALMNFTDEDFENFEEDSFNCTQKAG
jgi:transcriptional regulator with XRE-family HTH domain